jgi:hypothetical protein
MVETFIEARELAPNPGYAEERRRTLAAIEWDGLDAPVVDVVRAFEPLPYCFTLQCCHGHFLTETGQDAHDLAPLPEGYGGAVRYRIAYVAFVVEPGELGRAFLDRMSRVPTLVDAAYVQFGSAGWFWDQWVDSYVLQVEPAAHRFKDQAVLTAGEALRTQRVRDEFFEELRQLLAEERRRTG